MQVGIEEFGLNMWLILHVHDNVAFKATYVWVDLGSLIGEDNAALGSETLELLEEMRARRFPLDKEAVQSIVDYSIESFDILDD